MVTYELLHSKDLADADIADINALLPQLTSNPRTVDTEKMREICDNSIVLVARNPEGAIVGMNTMCILHIPTGKVAFLEDVVVDSSMLGQGVGKELIKRLIDIVRKNNLADRIELTCHPTRDCGEWSLSQIGVYTEGDE